MQRRLVALLASAVTVLAMTVLSINGAAAQGSAKPYSRAWLAQHHTQYDTTLTALYEAQIHYGVGSAAGLPLRGSQAPAALHNIQMSSASFLGNQNEFQIAINPTNHLNAIGASNDGRTSGTGYYRTSDGGRTWFAADMPGIGTSCCDPGVAFDASGNAYFINLDTSPTVIHTLKSTDGGVTWVKKTDVTAPDRPNIAIDTWAGSPHLGRIYLTYTNFAATNEINLVHSDDGAVTWSTPVNVSHTSSSGSAYPQSSNPTVASDGTVYVGFQYYPSGTKASAKDMIAKSSDGGATFSTATTINADANLQPGLEVSGDARGYFAVNTGCTIFRHRAFPIIRTDPTTPATVYAVWAGGSLELPYSCGSLHGVHSDILFSRSTDGGTTWSAPLKINDDPEGSDQYYPWMDVAANGKIWIGWHDRRDDPSNFKHLYYLDGSSNGGVSFGVDRKLGSVASLPNSFIGDYAGLAATNDLVLPMWWDSRASASGDPFTNPTRVH